MKMCRKNLHEMTPNNTGVRNACRACFKIYNDAYRIKNQPRIAARVSVYARTVKGRFNLLKNNAKYCGWPMELSFEEYQKLVSGACYYCGGDLPETGYGVDRIDSSLGYVENNVRPCCTGCNKAKLDRTEFDFKAWVLRIHSFWACK